MLKFLRFVILLLVMIMLNRHVTCNRSAEPVAQGQSMEYNDVSTNWLDEKDRIHRTIVPCPAEDYRYILLPLQGVDTFASVYLGDRLVGSTENMFVRYRYNVKGLCDEKTKELRIQFRSTVVEAREPAKRHAMPILPTCPPSMYFGHPSYTCDCGPATPSMGIRKPVRLEYYNSALIRDLTVNICEHHKKWTVEVGVHIETGLFSKHLNGLLRFKIMYRGVPLVNKSEETLEVKEQTDANGELLVLHQLTVRQDLVERWWPNGFGKQMLYNLYVRWEDTEISEKLIRIGFRTVELVQDKKSDGLLSHFKVNNVTIFAKGSNWIPKRSYDANYVKFLMYAARDAHMNMLRVWSGELYESDHFYQMADELGILIWHDLMFACSMYQTDADFLRTVKDEVRQNVRRVQHHPSVAVWATNSKNEVALRQDWYKTKTNFTAYFHQYDELYKHTVLPTLKQNDPWRTVLHFSSFNGKQTMKEPYNAENPQDPLYRDEYVTPTIIPPKSSKGTVSPLLASHYYNYILDGWNAIQFRNGRFVSEYDFQSFSAFTSWPVARSYDHDELSQLISHGQYSPNGNLPITPTVEYLIYLSQLSQAMIVKNETEVYRLEHGTMGALHWQLNDVRIAPSWSSIEYGGTFKLLHVWLRDIYAPEHLIAFVNKHRMLEVVAVRDTLAPAHELWDVEMRIHRYGSFRPVDRYFETVRVAANSVALVTRWDVYRHLYKRGLRPADHLVLLYAYRNETSQSGHRQQEVSKRIAENFVLLGKLKNIRKHQRVRPTIAVTVVSSVCNEGNNRTSVSLEVSVSVPALFVYLHLTPEHRSLKQCQFSHNGFLQFQPIRTVQLTCVDPGCRNKIQSRNITVRTVNELLVR